MDPGELQEIEENPQQELWFITMWKHARPRVILVGSEQIVGVALLFGLSIFYLACRLLIVAGVPEDDLDFAVRTDGWGLKAVLSASVITFVADSFTAMIYALKRTARAAFRGESK